MNIKNRMNIKDEDVIKMSGDIIEWYYNQASKNGDLIKLMKAQDRLSALSYNIAQITADYKGEYNESYFIKKINHNIQKQAFINQGDSGVVAESNAIVKTKEEIKKEKQAEANSYRMDLLLKQINKVLSAMQQKISHLKNEYERQQRSPNTTA